MVTSCMQVPVANPKRAHPAPGEPVKVLFIGNSLTFGNDLPGMLKTLAADADPAMRIEVSSITHPGLTLEKHWKRGEAQKAIREGEWHYVVLQGQSAETLTHKNNLFRNIRRFDTEINQSGAKTLLYMTWALQKAPQNQQKITNAYQHIGKQIGAQVIPVGVAREKLLKLKPDAPIYTADGKHPSPLGTYLAACVFYSSLSGQSPTGLSATVPNPSNPKQPHMELTENEALLYQQIAEESLKAVATQGG